MYEFPQSLLDSLVKEAEVFEVRPPGNRTLLADYAFARKHGSVILVSIDDIPTGSIPSKIAHDFDLGVCLWLLDIDIQNVLSAPLSEDPFLSVGNRSMILMIANALDSVERGDIPRAAFPDWVFGRIAKAGLAIPIAIACHWVATMSAVRGQRVPLDILASAVTSATSTLRSIEASGGDAASEWSRMRGEWSKELIDSLKASAEQ